MGTLTAPRRAVAAAAVGLVLSLSLAACSRMTDEGAAQAAVAQTSQEVSAPTATPAATPDPVGCMLWQSHGDLVAENGRPVFRSIQFDIPPEPVPLDVPDGWEIHATDGGQFQIVDETGTVQAATGTRVIVNSDADISTPLVNADGALVVCAIHPYGSSMDGGGAP